MKKHLRAMLEALITDDMDAASKHLHAYLASTTRRLVLDEADDKDDDDKDDDTDDKKSKKKSKKENPFKKKSKKDDDDDECEECGKSPCECKEDVKEGLGSSHPSGWAKNEKGMAYHAVPHKGSSEGYNNPKGKKNLDGIAGSKDTGAKGKVAKVKSKKGKSEGYQNPKGKKGLKDISGGHPSPDSDGKRVNRRTDKAKGKS